MTDNKAKKINFERSNARSFASSVVASAIFTLAFAFRFLYSVGLDAANTPSSSIESLFPAWLQAVLVGVCAWLITWIGSKMSYHYIVLNPLEAIVHAAVFARRVGSARRGLVKLFFIWLGLFVGSLLATLVVYLLGALHIEQMQNTIVRIGSDNVQDSPDGNQLARVYIGETLGAIVIVIVTASAHALTHPREKCGANYNMYGKALGFFWFFYMVLFWVHTRLSVDFIRSGVFCIFSDKDAPCAAITDRAFRSSVYVISLAPHIVVAVIAFIVIYNMKYRAK